MYNKINEFKVQRIGFREYDTIDVPWTSDDFVEEDFEKLAIYWLWQLLTVQSA
jgi:hypothetical protein